MFLSVSFRVGVYLSVSFCVNHFPGSRWSSRWWGGGVGLPTGSRVLREPGSYPHGCVNALHLTINESLVVLSKSGLLICETVNYASKRSISTESLGPDFWLRVPMLTLNKFHALYESKNKSGYTSWSICLLIISSWVKLYVKGCMENRLNVFPLGFKLSVLAFSFDFCKHCIFHKTCIRLVKADLCYYRHAQKVFI